MQLYWLIPAKRSDKGGRNEQIRGGGRRMKAIKCFPPILMLSLLAPTSVVARFEAVSTADYPPEALQNHWDGVVYFSVTVDPQGHPVDCKVTQSSGHKVLDETACSMIKTRANFTPAIDEMGQAVRAQYSSKFAFTLPDQPHPVGNETKSRLALHAAAETPIAPMTLDMTTPPTSASGFVERGELLLKRRRFDEALADFGKAIELEPKNGDGLARRGLAYAWKGDYDLASKDLDAAAVIDPKNAMIFHARGLIAEHRGAYQEAVAQFGRAIEIWRDDAFAYEHRAEAQWSQGDYGAASADATRAIELSPDFVLLYLLKANIFRGQSRIEQAQAEAKAVSAANPRLAYAHVVAAVIYARCHNLPEAMQEFEQAIRIDPSPYIYLNRSHARAPSDFAGRQIDVDAAMKLDPKSSDSLSAKAELEESRRDYTSAAETWSASITAGGDPVNSLVHRGIDYARGGEAALAERDFSTARSKATTPQQFNSMCWAKATAGVALASALSDCDAALTKAPGNANFLDSRGFVLLRIGRLDDALTDYGHALAQRPRLAASLYGRAAIEARRGNSAKANSDAQAALQADPDVRDDFERYGVVINKAGTPSQTSDTAEVLKH